MGFYAAQNDSFVLAYLDNLLVRYSSAKQSSLPNLRCIKSQKSADVIYTAVEACNDAVTDVAARQSGVGGREWEKVRKVACSVGVLGRGGRREMDGSDD